MCLNSLLRNIPVTGLTQKLGGILDLIFLLLLLFYFWFRIYFSPFREKVAENIPLTCTEGSVPY